MRSKTKECIMKKFDIHHSSIFAYIIFLILLCGLFYSSNSHANTKNSLAGTQIAYFIGYHSGGMYNGGGYHNSNHVYYKPRYHYRGSYKTPWTYIGHNCRKTCWVDRWTGRSLRCYRSC